MDRGNSKESVKSGSFYCKSKSEQLQVSFHTTNIKVNAKHANSAVQKIVALSEDIALRRLQVGY